MAGVDDYEPRMSAPTMAGLCQEGQAKQFKDDLTFISDDPEVRVILSHRLERLARRIGGCSTEEVLSLVRRIMFEVLQHQRR